MEIIKDPRHCSKCANYPCSNLKYFSTDANLNDIGCSNWKDRKGQDYNGYTYTWKYKWIQFRNRHYGHPIQDFVIEAIMILIAAGLIYSTIVSSLL